MSALISIIVVFLVIVFGPLFTIWSINTLFGLGIAYTFKTWLASLILGILICGRETSKK